jgi:hypothetical protein
MAIRTKAEFSEALRGKEIPIDQLVGQPEARGLETAIHRANLDGNEVIAGTGEVDALWKVVDSLDDNGVANSVKDQGRAADLIDLTLRIARPTRGSIWKEVAKAGVRSIDSKTKAHLDAIERTGIGTYYGDHSSFKGMSAAERRDWVDANKKVGTQPSYDIREGSCIGWVLDNAGAAYQAVGKGGRWEDIMAFVRSKGTTGYALMCQLQTDGWKAVHITADPAACDRDGQYVAGLAKRGKPVTYGQAFGGLQLSPDRNVIDFGADTAIDQHPALSKLSKVPFWVGMVNGGFHTFVGKGTTVSEFHWAEMPNSTNAIEESDLRAFSRPGRSIIVMVPPSSWA